MLTLLLILLPLLFSAVLFFIPDGKRSKQAALVFAVSEGVLAIAATFHIGNKSLMSFDTAWSSFGARFTLGMDGISMILVLLTGILVPFIIFASFRADYNARFYSLVLLMQAALVGVFTAMDGFLFYIFWELALIPIYFICLGWGGENRARITFKFFIYTITGSLIMLVALLYLYYATPGEHSFAIKDLYAAGHELSRSEQGWIFWALFIAFAIKMPVFPFHTWQPDTYVTAPTPGTMLLSGIMLKMGTYGLIRWLIPMVPKGWDSWAMTAIILSIVSIVYASCLAIVQKDYKRLIAYSSIAHVGLISAGIFAFNGEGLTGSLLQMFAHGITVVGLFYIADIIFSRTKTRNIESLGGIRAVAPDFALLFLIILLGSIALPLTSSFVGEFLLINGVFQYNNRAAFFAGLTIILGAVYMLRSYQSMMLGSGNAANEVSAAGTNAPEHENTPTSENSVNRISVIFADLNAPEKLFLSLIAILILFFGVYPKPLIDMVTPAVQEIMKVFYSGLIG